MLQSDIPPSKIIYLPKSVSTEKDEVTTHQSLVCIGANGSGKTRLGSWIENQSPDKERVHRISAHKSLVMPDSTTSTSIDQAKNNLLHGHPKPDFDKATLKYQGKPATHLVSDFDKLMVYLFSEESESNATFKTESNATNDKVKPPITKMDELKRVWEKIFPHRELVIGGKQILTKVKNPESSPYNSSEMSDGERVGFYLVGQCLATPKDGIIVIDEPELHLHKSVRVPLWSEIEKLRNDCVFIYLTHDVDFASAQEGATKIWLKSFDSQSWDWEVINPDQNLPEQLLLEVLGSRKPVVFVEGDNNSYDAPLYREILDRFLVIPVGSCSQVIQSVKALKANSQLHHLEIYGLVDRDRKGCIVDPENWTAS